MATIAPGKHRRPGPKMQAPAALPFRSAEFVQAPVDLSGPAADYSGTWAPYADCSPAQEPRVPARLVPGAGGAEEAAHLRAVILSLSEQLSEMSAYVIQNLGSPANPATLGPSAAAPAQTPATPPRRPMTRPGGPAATRPGQADSGTSPARKPPGQPRQYHAMRFATYTSAALLVFALLSGATEMGLRGFRFFVFRSGGTGETAGSETDQQFLARQAHAALRVEAPKGRHVIKAHGVRNR